MAVTAVEILAVAVMVLGLVLVPLGIPGLWVMIAALAVSVLLGAPVAWWTVLGLALLAGLGELGEYLAVKVASDRYGGSDRAFWAAVAGGLVGGVVGTPVPVVGSLVGVLVGTFAGAVAVAWWEARDAGAATRVGWGALLGRAAAAAVKTTAGLVILLVAVGAFWLW